MSKPKIRFKGYCNDWERRKLGEIITEYKETVDSDCTLPILTSSRTEGVILQEEHFGRKQQHDITGYNILPRNYCTYRNRSDGVDFTFNINKCCDKGIISKFYPVFSGNNSDVFFLSLVLNNSEEVVHEIAYTCTGTGQKVLSFLDLQKMRVRVPSFEEQKKVGEIITTLDHLITLHQRQCENAKKLKKFMLQKMFPKKNQKNPEIRFVGFTNDWERRKLCEICERVTRKNKNNESDLPLTIASQFGLIDQRDFFNKVVAAKDMSNYYLLKKGEFAYNKSYSNGFDYGSIKRLNAYEQGCLSTLYICFGITSDEVESNYLECFFDTLKWYEDVSVICTEGARNHGLLNVDTKGFFDEVTVDLPKSLEEQKKISAYLNALDHLITLHQNKCDELKKLKKFMLQNMFI